MNAEEAKQNTAAGGNTNVTTANITCDERQTEDKRNIVTVYGKQRKQLGEVDVPQGFVTQHLASRLEDELDEQSLPTKPWEILVNDSYDTLPKQITEDIAVIVRTSNNSRQGTGGEHQGNQAKKQKVIEMSIETVVIGICTGKYTFFHHCSSLMDVQLYFNSLVYSDEECENPTESNVPTRNTTYYVKPGTLTTGTRATDVPPFPEVADAPLISDVAVWIKQPAAVWEVPRSLWQAVTDAFPAGWDPTHWIAPAIGHTNETGQVDKIWSMTVHTLRPSRTEYSYVTVWDLVIVPLLEIFNVDHDRNTTRGSATEGLKPDFLAYFGGCALFRGEEKSPERDNPEEELKKMQVFAFSGIDYCFGYTAEGHTFSLYLLQRGKHNKTELHRLYMYDLSSRSARVEVVLVLGNVFRLCQHLRRSINVERTLEYVHTAYWSDVRVVKKEFTKNQDHFLKSYVLAHQRDTLVEEAKNYVAALRKLRGTQGIPTLVETGTSHALWQNKKVPLNSMRVSVAIQPLGVAWKSQPKQELLIQAIEALQACHSNDVVHRDVRADNLIVHNNQLYLIDFDNCHIGNINTIPATQALNHRDNAPELRQNQAHSYKVDVWGILVIIRDTTTRFCSSAVREKAKDALEKGASDRLPEFSDILGWFTANRPSL
eukprot:TRINITY_DN67886_c1_g1_i8.p1 TRINITY_DN67886_c1_g1~~TRINITY_DN67886_c1_g1_i8.p1  ORF type:complete len:656 (+),score=60.18 TRINITY_DN67886_c1_g1_i8:164-2131(+)